MAQTGYTPISLYYTTTAAAVPTAGNLVAGELALNTNDGKLYYKNSSGVVTLLAGATSGPAGGSTTQVQYNNAGVLAGITGATTNGTALTLVAPVLGTPASGTVTNLTGTASININGTVGATTPAAGAFTSGTFSTTLGVTGAASTGALTTTAKAIIAATQPKTVGDESAWHLRVRDDTAAADGVGGGIVLTGYYSGGSQASFGAIAAERTGAGGNGNLRLYYSVLGVLTNGGLISSTGFALPAALSVTGAGSIEGLTVGRGGGAVNGNTTLGNAALSGSNTGTNLTAIGYTALATNTSGASNTAVGFQALVGNTSGSNNTAFGKDALVSNTTASNNTAVGYQAGYANITGVENTYIGRLSGYFATGSNNTCLGVNAGYNLTTGAKNTIIGAYTGNQGGLDIRTQSNYIVLSDGDGNPRQIIDSSGNLGLGVTPSAWSSTFKGFQLGSTGSIWAIASGNGGTYYGNNYIYGASGRTYLTTGTAVELAMASGKFEFGIAASGTAGDPVSFTSAMTLDASGNLLVGITSGTSYKLSLKTSSASQSAIGTAGTSGDTAFQAILINKFDNDSTTSQNFIQFQINNGGANCGKITANGANTAAFGSTSDQRVKENIVELPSQLDNIMALRPVEFDYLESYGGGHQIGFIAQEMQQVYPDVISKEDTEEKILSITGWSKTEARLVKAIQEQQAIITALTTRITALENK